MIAKVKKYVACNFGPSHYHVKKNLRYLKPNFYYGKSHFLVPETSFDRIDDVAIC